MKLKDILNLANDEMWVRIDNANIDYIWMADYTGGREETLDELCPFLEYEVDEFWLETFEDPERGNKAPLMVISLNSNHHKSEKRSDTEILKDIVQAIQEHECNRDCKLDFYSDHGYESENLTDEQAKGQEIILTDIHDSHDKLQKLIGEYLGDPNFRF